MRTPTSFVRTPRRLIQLLAVAAAFAVVLGAAGTASATSPSVAYSLAGTGTSVPGGGCLDCQAPTMDASGTATCTVCLAGEPTSGDFTINLRVVTHPPSPCKVQSVSGLLSMTWVDGTTSSATVSGKFRDSKSLSLSGLFDSTDPVYPGASTKILLYNHPPSPCLAATNSITGSLAISIP